MVGSDQDAHAADTDQDTGDLGEVVADFEEDEGDDDDGDDGEEVDELGGEDGCVAVREYGEVVAFDVEEGEDDVFPAVFYQEGEVAARFVPVDGVGCVEEVEEDVVEEGLEGGDGGALFNQ